MMTAETPKRAGWVTLLLIVLPLWLVVSGVFAIWFFFHREKKEAQAEQARFVQTVSVPGLADDLRKFVEIIGERHGGSETAAKNLTRAASMIEGVLGPSNTGFAVRRIQGPAAWPLLQVTIKGLKPDSPAIWVLASYDSRPGSPGAEANASGLAATLAAAQALAADKPEMDIHFAFIPHANDPESPILETAAKFTTVALAPKTVLCVEAMGAGDELWLSSRDITALPFTQVQGLGSVRGAEVVCLGDDVDFASILFESGIPAVRVSTRPLVTGQEADDQLPPAPVVAASTGRLVELIRRCVSAR
jgi:hypothetical protein